MAGNAYGDGVDAAVSGKPVTDNPHAETDTEHAEWIKGYNSAEPTDPHKDGIDDFGRGVARGDCIYPEGTDAKELWEDGWDEAKSADSGDEIPTENLS